MPQNSVASAPARGFAGQIAEPDAGLRCSTAFAEGASVSAGMPVKRGTDPEKQVEPLEAGDGTGLMGKFCGVVVLDPTRPYSSDAIEDGDPVAVMTRGQVYMNFSEAVTAGEDVGITLATGALTGWAAGTAAGSITTGIVILPGLRVIDTIGGAGVARVDVNILQSAATVGSA